MIDETENDPAAMLLSRQVFSVYCDQLALDAVKQNDELKTQNKKMEAARNMLIHMEIYKGPDELLKINLPQFVTKDAACHMLIYPVHDAGIEFPYEDIPMLHCKLSNVGLSGGASDVLSRVSGENRPKLTVEQNNDDNNNEETNIQLEFHAANDVVLTGTLTNLAGTVQDIQAMIDSNRFITQYSMMGFVDAVTGRPVTQDIDNSLDGAICYLDTVRIARSIIHPIVLMSNHEAGDYLVDNASEEHKDELQVLAKVNGKHAVLVKAAMNQKALKSRNLLLQASRQLLQTITARHGNNGVQFLLEHGSIGYMAHDEDRAAWVIQSPYVASTEEYLTIPLSDFAMLQLDLVNIPWSRPHGSAFPPVMRPDLAPRNDNHVILHYAHDVEAVFCINDNDSLWRDNFGLLALLNPIQQEHIYQRSQMTMRLVRIQIHLTTIQHHLRVLGIEAVN